MISNNALDYNPPTIPRSREIRGRAFEFWDAAGILLEENLSPPDLAEQVAEVCVKRLRSTFCISVPPCIILITPPPTLHFQAIAACPLDRYPPHRAGRGGLNESRSMSRLPQQASQPPPLPTGQRYSRRLHVSALLLFYLKCVNQA